MPIYRIHLVAVFLTLVGSVARVEKPSEDQTDLSVADAHLSEGLVEDVGSSRFDV